MPFIISQFAFLFSSAKRRSLFSPIRKDVYKRQVLAYEGKECELTKNELRILYNLFCHKGEIVARDDLIDDLWDNKLFIDDNALSVNITSCLLYTSRCV